MANQWSFREGDITTRQLVKDAYGGTIFGGIEPSRTSPNIIIYTDPEQGSLSGYNYDGWDRFDPNVFYYTGEGRTGDQAMRDGNRAILEHGETRRSLRLFEAADGKKRPGGKRQRYLGAFYVDPKTPYRFEPAPDKDGRPRKVIVFRLVREGARPMALEPAPPVPEAVRSKPQQAETKHGTSASTTTTSRPPETKRAHAKEPGVEIVAPEDNRVAEYETSPRTGNTAMREEGKLVRQFEAHLRSRGHEVGRVRIRIPGEKGSLVTDTFDRTDQILYEAKSGSDRATVRLGIGQVLDYLRFLPDASGALLLPTEPSADLKDLVSSCGLRVTYRRLGSWISE